MSKAEFLEAKIERKKNELVKIGFSEEQALATAKQFYESVDDEAKADVPREVVKVEHITTMSELQNYAKGAVVKLPDFAEGQPFVARLRRPSMLVLSKKGKIPNQLMSQASELFAGGSQMNTNDPELLNNLSDLMRVICEASLIEPTLEEIDNSGVDLTDEQMMAIFNYSQTGNKALTPSN